LSLSPDFDISLEKSPLEPVSIQEVEKARVMKFTLLIAALLLVTACAATSTSHGKRGSRGLHINCSGLTSSWTQCEKEAESACGPAGYRTLAKSSDVKEEPDDYVFGLNPAGYSTRSMIVKCRKSSAFK
jgi:hypothetical protein